jgi:hypothetical protein
MKIPAGYQPELLTILDFAVEAGIRPDKKIKDYFTYAAQFSVDFQTTTNRALNILELGSSYFPYGHEYLHCLKAQNWRGIETRPKHYVMAKKILSHYELEHFTIGTELLELDCLDSDCLIIHYDWLASLSLTELTTLERNMDKMDVGIAVIILGFKPDIAVKNGYRFQTEQENYLLLPTWIKRRLNNMHMGIVKHAFADGSEWLVFHT